MQGSQPVGRQPTIRVLLVEDNPGDARLIQELLKEAKGGEFETVVVPRLSEAMERLDREKFRLILLDLSLPDSHGIETFYKMTAHAPLIPLIVLSGLDDEALALQTVETGAQDYLVKGQVDPRILERAIRYAMKRVEAERALAEERNLLRSVIDNLLDSIYVKDAQGRYLLDNIAHRRLLGVDAAENVVGKSIFDFFPPAAASKFQEDDAAVLRLGRPVVNREEVLVASDSATVRWMSTTKVPLRNRSGQVIGVVGIGRDITERKAAEEQIFRYNAEIRQRNVELEDDLHMAREIQQAFLPQQYPTFPRGASPAASAIRNHPVCVAARKAGTKNHVRLAFQDRRHEAGVFPWVVFQIRVLHDDTISGRRAEPRSQSRSLALVALVKNDFVHQRADFAIEYLARVVGGGVVDNNDFYVFDRPVANGVDDVSNGLFLIKTGDDDG